MNKETNNDKSCSRKKGLMLAYGMAQLGTRVVTAISLAVIAFSFCSVKKEAQAFNGCVEGYRQGGGSVSGAVHFCNGGN